MSAERQAKTYEEKNNTGDLTNETGEEGETISSDPDSESKNKPAMKLTQAEEMDSLNHISKAVHTKDNQPNCDTNHEPNDEAETNHNTSADDIDNPESVSMADIADTEVGDINNSNSVEVQAFGEGVPITGIFMSQQCSQIPSAPLGPLVDGQMYPVVASPNQPIPAAQGTMHSPQMGAYGQNGGTKGPSRQQPTAHMHGGSLQFSSSATPPQSGTSTPNTMNNGSQAAGHQHVVHVHINAGERFSVRVDDQIQHIEGKNVYNVFVLSPSLMIFL